MLYLVRQPAGRLPDIRPDDEAQIQYTSGTTGFPKGAVLRHRGITNNARFCAEILQAAPGEVWVNPMPLFHTAGCVMLTLGPVQGQVTQVLVPGFEPGLVLNLLESERSAIFGGVPTMLLAVLDHPGFPGAGVPDDYWGEQVAAFIQRAPGEPVTQEELAAYCRSHLAAHKTPRHWVFTGAFPLTPSGKVQRFLLREQFVSPGTAASP